MDVQLQRRIYRDSIIEALVALGAVRVEVTFAGSGDSGSVECVYAFDKDNNELDTDDVPFKTKSFWRSYSARGWTHEMREQDGNLRDALAGMCEQALDENDIDWYNNDGGQGSMHITIDAKQPPSKRAKINLEVDLNYTTSSHHSFKVA